MIVVTKPYADFVILKTLGSSVKSVIFKFKKKIPGQFSRLTGPRKPQTFLNPHSLRQSSIRFSGSSINNPQLTCDLLPRYLSPVYVPCLHSSYLLLVDVVCPASPTILLRTPLPIEYLIGKPDANVDPSCNSLSNIFLLESGQSIFLFLSIIFNKSLAENHFPGQWKEALIISIHKSGNGTLNENYLTFFFSPLSVLIPFFTRLVSYLSN